MQLKQLLVVGIFTSAVMSRADDYCAIPGIDPTEVRQHVGLVAGIEDDPLYELEKVTLQYDYPLTPVAMFRFDIPYAWSDSLGESTSGWDDIRFGVLGELTRSEKRSAAFTVDLQFDTSRDNLPSTDATVLSLGWIGNWFFKEGSILSGVEILQDLDVDGTERINQTTLQPYWTSMFDCGGWLTLAAPLTVDWENDQEFIPVLHGQIGIVLGTEVTLAAHVDYRVDGESALHPEWNAGFGVHWYY